MRTGIPDELVLASGNAGKLAELQQLLEPLGSLVHPQSDWSVPEAVEDGIGFVENALIKARHAAFHCKLPAIADDSGLVVPALGGAPGVHSARYAGRHGDDDANNRKLVHEMASLRGADRAAYFICVMVLVRTEKDPVPVIAQGRWWGQIAHKPSGSGGFGYDPLFYLEDRACTSAELAPDEKNRLSHRGRAARQLVSALVAHEDG
ncbi:MAG: RdgB/HAM1 family non-canonical purine NTP pyrophosphatase [Xanthomonadales bacterium]|nr:RdgB/HAM1 family non-canonical purine NTP pyrophosphatase [Xanthomonadales bacterium]